MNSNTSQAFGFQTGSISDKQGSLKVKLAHLEVSTFVDAKSFLGSYQGYNRRGRVPQERGSDSQGWKRTVRKRTCCQGTGS